MVSRVRYRCCEDSVDLDEMLGDLEREVLNRYSKEGRDEC